MRTLILRAKKRVFNAQMGLFGSPFGKEGYDFFDLEPYDFSSDAKRIDWKSYARTRQLNKKNFTEERSKNIHIIPLLCGSLFFGSSRLKIETLLETVAILGFSALRTREKLYLLAQPIRESFELERALQKLADTNLIGKKASLEPTLFYQSPKSLTIIIGDFLDPLDLSLWAARDDVVAIIIRDHLETDAILSEEAIVVDTITKEQRSADLAATMHGYHANIATITQRVQQHLFRNDIATLTLYNDSDIFTRLLHFFGSR